MNEVLCSCVELKRAGKALVLDPDRTRRIATLIILPDLGVAAVVIALGLSQIRMAGIVLSGGVITRCVGHMFSFR